MVTSTLPPDSRAQTFSLYIYLAIHGGGDTYGACALGHQLLLFQDRKNGTCNLALLHRDYIVHILAHQVKGQVAGVLT